MVRSEGCTVGVLVGVLLEVLGREPSVRGCTRLKAESGRGMGRG